MSEIEIKESFSLRGAAPWDTHIDILVEQNGRHLRLVQRTGDIETSLYLEGANMAKELGEALIRASRHATPSRYGSVHWEVRDGITIPQPTPVRGSATRTMPYPSIDDVAIKDKESE